MQLGKIVHCKGAKSAKVQTSRLNIKQELLAILLIFSFKIRAERVGWVKRSAPNKTIMMGSLRLTHPTQYLSLSLSFCFALFASLR
jgi:hypothetical protein